MPPNLENLENLEMTLNFKMTLKTLNWPWILSKNLDFLTLLVFFNYLDLALWMNWNCFESRFVFWCLSIHDPIQGLNPLNCEFTLKFGLGMNILRWRQFSGCVINYIQHAEKVIIAKYTILVAKIFFLSAFYINPEKCPNCEASPLIVVTR